MLLGQRKFNIDVEPAPHRIPQQNFNVILNNPAIYGNSNAFNIQTFAIGGGGNYIKIFDGATAIWQRRNNSGGTDITVNVSSSNQNLIDKYSTITYDKFARLLTLSGAVDTFNGVQFTRSETYKFISDYIIENTWTITVNANGGTLTFNNWNYYLSAINGVIDVGSTNFGDGTSTKPLGFGVRFSSSGPTYGVISANDQETRNNRSKQALAASNAICVHAPSAVALTTTQGLTLKQWFYKAANTQPDFMGKAQNAVGVAKGYSGDQFSQALQAASYLNLKLMSNLTDTLAMPSLHYTAGMWMRDSFWQGFVLPNSLEQNIITQFENKQQAGGQISTRLSTGGNSAELHNDESTLMYVIRAYYDKFVRGLTVNNTALASALTYINSIVVADQYINDSTDSGSFKSWWDVYITNTGTYSSYKQGMYCLALICGQALGLSITNTQINNAITQYQALYNTQYGFMSLESDQNAFDISGITPEALSIFITGKQLLTDTMVKNHINFIVNTANTIYGAKCICNPDGSYLNSNRFSSGGFTGGDYQNGGSWFLYEYLAYYAGKKHGLSGMDALITARKAIEINNEPVSHEYLQTSGGLSFPGSEDSSRHAYSWNAATLIIK